MVNLVSLQLYYQNKRAFYRPFSPVNDVNPKTQRAGIAVYQHKGIKLLFARLFNRVVKYEDRIGQCHYFNKKSLCKWLGRHGEKIRSYKIDEINKRVLNILLKEKQADLDFKSIRFAVTNEQVKALNFSAMTQQQFRDIIYSSRVTLLSEAQMHVSLKHFTREHVAALSHQQLKFLNLKALTDEQFAGLQLGQIRYLSGAHIKASFMRFDTLQLKVLTSEQAAELVPLLSKEEIQQSYKKFGYSILSKLSQQQCEDLIPLLDEESLSNESFFGDLMTNEARLKLLTPNHIESCKRYLDEDRASWLTNDQLKAVKIDGLDKATKDIIAAEKKTRKI